MHRESARRVAGCPESKPWCFAPLCRLQRALLVTPWPTHACTASTGRPDTNRETEKQTNKIVPARTHTHNRDASIQQILSRPRVHDRHHSSAPLLRFTGAHILGTLNPLNSDPHTRFVRRLRGIRDRCMSMHKCSTNRVQHTQYSKSKLKIAAWRPFPPIYIYTSNADQGFSTNLKNSIKIS